MRYVFLLYLAISATTIWGQGNIGLTASYGIGLTQADNEFRDLTRRSFGDRIQHTEQEVGLTYGLSYRADFSRLFLRADGVVTESTQRFTVAEFVRGESGIMDNFRSYESSRYDLSFPITAGVRLGKLDVGAGPVLNFAIDQSIEGDLPSSVTTHDRNVRMGANFYAGYNITSHLTIHARYIANLHTLGNDYRYAGSPMRLDKKTARLDIGLAYYL